MGALDHLLAVLVAVVLPSLSRPPSADERARIEADADLRRALVLPTMVVQWLLALACLWRVEANGADGAALGLSPRGHEPGLALAWSAVAGILIWRVLRAPRIARDPARRARALDEARATAPFLPRETGEGRRWVLLSFTAGLCEEVVYRGFLVGYGLVLTGGEFGVPRPDQPAAWAAATAAAAAFGGAHLYQGRRAALKVGAAGLVLGALYVVSGSLWPGILLHMFVDVHEGWLFRALLAREVREQREGRA